MQKIQHSLLAVVTSHIMRYCLAARAQELFLNGALWSRSLPMHIDNMQSRSAAFQSQYRSELDELMKQAEAKQLSFPISFYALGTLVGSIALRACQEPQRFLCLSTRKRKSKWKILEAISFL
ncbi:hypothetical protein B0T26DRAFT_734465 [Lasiosphaeria miniovina]|uniref:Uncharacterized protein n=1 Tax=Lasiosphaeria miniovina TaxID=1954250 RepID=A0AA39ZQH8_9PEZI|nr:uncharacterized protein B0T26DRAFT_734465 [Lasiosphaeria miniovina]KAK0701738.1 hypothetical protein B0T26DRAFT_734465 [Lasiosphaeria miniovina]